MATPVSQRFCLRWNNHQSNLLSVFDQLLHDESFVDVTLAVEGRFLRAHKMVLSACSPYFQALFVGHPDKHPIVILKDVPYCDMRSLLDFMYRGEVSVDQERLTAFLKVAESLRIKGLTEVNEEKCDLPLITSSLLSERNSLNNHPPPPHLHRIHPFPSSYRRVFPPMPSANLLGSALTSPKRKRGRPRKLSGSSGGPENGSPRHISLASMLESNGESEGPLRLTSGTSNEINEADDSSEQGDTRMEFQTIPAPGSGSQRLSEQLENGPTEENPSPKVPVTTEQEEEQKNIKEEKNSTNVTETLPIPVKVEAEPKPGTSAQDPGQTFARPGGEPPDSENFHPDPMLLTPKSEPALNDDASIASGHRDWASEGAVSPQSTPPATTSTPVSGRPPIKRRVRRRATSSSQDPAEQLTEMSVRGLNLFRYASITDGVYQCMECAKADILKTFKNKYSFQRHAFLYHEGHQRKVFPCPVCAKEFSRPDKMKNHMKTVHDCFMPKDCVFPLGFFLPP